MRACLAAPTIRSFPPVSFIDRYIIRLLVPSGADKRKPQSVIYIVDRDAIVTSSVKLLLNQAPHYR